MQRKIIKNVHSLHFIAFFFSKLFFFCIFSDAFVTPHLHGLTLQCACMFYMYNPRAKASMHSYLLLKNSKFSNAANEATKSFPYVLAFMSIHFLVVFFSVILVMKMNIYSMEFRRNEACFISNKIGFN